MSEERNPRETPRLNVPRNLRPYYLGLLTRGARWNEIAGREAEDLLARHLAFLRKQLEAGSYRLAGPVDSGPSADDAPYVGMLIIEAASQEAALALASSDPGVQARRLGLEIFPVYLPSLEPVEVKY